MVLSNFNNLVSGPHGENTDILLGNFYTCYFEIDTMGVTYFYPQTYTEEIR